MSECCYTSAAAEGVIACLYRLLGCFSGEMQGGEGRCSSQAHVRNLTDEGMVSREACCVLSQRSQRVGVHSALGPGCSPSLRRGVPCSYFKHFGGSFKFYLGSGC